MATDSFAVADDVYDRYDLRGVLMFYLSETLALRCHGFTRTIANRGLVIHARFLVAPRHKIIFRITSGYYGAFHRCRNSRYERQ